MPLVELLSRFFNGYRTEWRLFHRHGVMECRIARHPSGGADIQFFYRGELYHSFVHPALTDAEAEAKQKRRELLDVGWSDRPGHTNVEHAS